MKKGSSKLLSTRSTTSNPPPAPESLAQLSLEKFCPKKLFEIELITPRTIQDEEFLKQIVETGKNYEYLSDVHFITYQDVMDLIERLTQNDNIHLSKSVKESAEIYLKEFQENMSAEFLATMTKLKIIEVMYEEYKSEVKKMQHGRDLHEKLNALLKDCESKEKKGKKKGKKGKKDKKGKKSKKDKSSKSSKKSTKKSSKKGNKKTKLSKTQVTKSKSKLSLDDYTNITLQKNELTFDYNVDNHVTYFILSDFPNPLILQELSKVNTEVSAVIDICLESSTKIPCEFILKLGEMFESPKITEYLENTVWMRFRSNGENPIKTILEELLFVIKNINYIKRQHLAYIKSLKLYSFETPKKLDVDCMEKYNRIMDSYPLDVVNIPLIVAALVQEVCWRELGPIYSLSDLSLSISSEVNDKKLKNYQVHEEDTLKIALETYGESGRLCYDTSLEYLKLLKPLSWIEFSGNQRRTENRGVSTEEECYCSDIKELFDYFHLAIFNQMKRNEFKPEKPQKYEFTLNLNVYDEVKHYQKSLPQGECVSDPEENSVIKYYHMKEDLSSSVLRQLIFKATKDFSSWEREFCEQTDSILLHFHDNLNEFGIDTKIWNQSLKTPVCLRDFCRFIANKEKKWLQENKLVEHEYLNLDEKEMCKGLTDLNVPEMYQEYHYLLDVSTGTSTEEKKAIFDNVIQELVEYPKSESLKNFCSEDGNFIAYDLGPKQCQLTGHTTIFHSDDGVKVTIDTTKFLVEDAKCSINIDVDDNSFVLHQPSKFHFILKDETIINFVEFDQNSENTELVQESKQNLSVESIPEITEEEETHSREVNYNDYWMQILRKSKLSESFPDFSKSVKLDDRNLQRLLQLFKNAVQLQRPIYKISTKASLRHLRRNSSPLLLPLVSILKRIITKPVHKKRKVPGYSVLNINKNMEKNALKYDFQITLPNGLFISTLPRNKQLIEVKQWYRFNYYKEQYRIFYSNGVILIKNFDGSTTIFRANGDIIKFTDQSDCFSNNCVTRAAKVFKHEDEGFCPFYSTRCDDSPKVQLRKDFVNLYEFGDIPYTKKSLLEFNGKKVTVSEDVMTEKQQYYVLQEHDYHADEVFFEREDGMKCLKDKKGKRVFQFPDGTKITSWPDVQKELIRVSKNPKVEGWVSIVTNYKFEHPDYITIMYDGAEETTQFFLKDGIIKTSLETLTMTTKQNIALEVSSENIILLKTCNTCDSDCICKIHLDSSSKLLEVYDSYDKYLTCDHFGRCEISSNYIKSAINKKACDHRWRNENEKFFILNTRGPPGTILWKDSSIENRIMEGKNCKTIKVTNYINKLTKKHTLEFYTDVYQNFSGRFTLSQLYNNNICLSKFKYAKNADKSILFYVTYRILMEFQNIADHPEVITELHDFLESKGGGISESMIEGIRTILERVSHLNEIKQDKCTYQIYVQEEENSEDTITSLSKSLDLNQTTAQDIVTKWRKTCEEYKFLIRNRKFPVYFYSDYYQHVLNVIKTK